MGRRKVPTIVQRNDLIETRRIAAINEEAVARRATVVVTGQEEEEEDNDDNVQRHLQSLDILHQDLLGPFQHHIIVIITRLTNVTVGHSIMIHTTHHHLDC